MDEITYTNLSDSLVRALPELRSQYEDELRWWGSEKPGPHVVYGDILMPHVIALVESDSPDESRALKRVFDFLETLAEHPDLHVQEVVQITVCERLEDNKEWLAKARHYMGPATLRLLREIQEFRGQA